MSGGPGGAGLSEMLRVVGSLPELRAGRAAGRLLFKLPGVAWAVANADDHHVHHLSAGMWIYRRCAAREQEPMFADTPVVTVRGGMAALRLNVWDEERGYSRVPQLAARDPSLTERGRQSLV